MKRFITKSIGLGTVLILLFILSELGVPSTVTTFRAWESIQTKYLFSYTPFYPNQNFTRDVYGDLAHHTKYEIKKSVKWMTDSLGFRNKKYVKSPSIVTIGASNIVGSSLSQEQTISEQLADLSNQSVYNAAPYHFNDFLKIMELGFFEKPSVLVYGSIERIIPFFKQIDPPLNNSKDIFSKIKSQIPVRLKIYLDKLLKSNTKNFIKARLVNSSELYIEEPSEHDKMFFLEGEKAKKKLTLKDIKSHAEVILNYSQYCENLGIKFIFFPIPNKETIYYNLVPFRVQPNYLELLIKELQFKNVTCINTLKLFNQKKDSVLLYHYDDSHWNENGVNAVAKELSKLVKH